MFFVNLIIFYVIGAAVIHSVCMFGGYDFILKYLEKVTCARNKVYFPESLVEDVTLITEHIRGRTDSVFEGMALFIPNTLLLMGCLIFKLVLYLED